MVIILSLLLLDKYVEIDTNILKGSFVCVNNRLSRSIVAKGSIIFLDKVYFLTLRVRHVQILQKLNVK